MISNLYSSEKLYKLSNFYLNLSFFLNDKFSPNKKLLAENLFFQKRYNESKKIYNSIKSIGSIYSWYASKSIASVSLITHDKEYSVSKLKKEFGKLPSHNFEHYYELANLSVDKDPMSIEFIEKIENYEFYEKAVKKDLNSIRHIP